MGYFKLTKAEIRIEPYSAGHATLFWFMFGVNPYKITPALYGEVEWCLPKPFMATHFGKATFHREGWFNGTP